MYRLIDSLYCLQSNNVLRENEGILVEVVRISRPILCPSVYTGSNLDQSDQSGRGTRYPTATCPGGDWDNGIFPIIRYQDDKGNPRDDVHCILLL